MDAIRSILSLYRQDTMVSSRFSAIKRGECSNEANDTRETSVSKENINKMANATSFIDKIVFINLQKRPDRLQQFLQEAQRMGLPEDKILRFDAVAIEDHGALGCSISHYLLWKELFDQGFKRILVFEDDFQFCVSFEHLLECMQKFKVLVENGLDFKVVMLAYNGWKGDTVHNILSVTTNVQTSSAYIISSEHAAELLQNVEQSIPQLHQTRNAYLFAFDMFWKRCQTDKWFVFSERLGTQREGFSDVEKRFVQYRV